MRRADEPLEEGDRIDGYRLSTGAELRADFVIGADGATSRVAGTAGLVDAKRVLWGFAVRTYLPHEVERPAIVFWEPTPWHAFPGYGWVFPGASDGANVGLGLGTLADRKAAGTVQKVLPRFLEHLRGVGLLAGNSSVMSVAPSRWLAQDGHGRDHSGSWTGAAGRRRRRPREPATGRGNLPGHDQWSVGRGVDPRGTRSRGAALSGCARVRPSALPPDRCRRAGMVGQSAMGRLPGWHGYS